MVLTQIAGVPGAKPSTTHLAIAESTSVDQPGNTAAGSHNPTQFASPLADLRAPGQAPEATDHADSISGKLTHEGSAEPSDSPFALEITTGYTLPPTGSVPPQDGRYLPLAPSEMASDRPLLSSENSPADNPISNTSQPDGSTGGVTRSGPATAPPVPIADTSAAPPGRQPDQVLMTTADLPQVDSIRETITPRASPPGESRQLQNLVEPGDSAAATGRSSTEFSSAGGFASSREIGRASCRERV